MATGIAAAAPLLGAPGGWLRAEYSVTIPAIVVIFIISGLGLRTRALLGALGDLRLHAIIQGLSLGVMILRRGKRGGGRGTEEVTRIWQQQ